MGLGPTINSEDKSSFKDFESFLKLIKKCLKSADEGFKSKLLAALIERIEVEENSIEIRFYTGKITLEEQTKVCSSNLAEKFQKKLPVFGSTRLTNGGA